MSEVPQQIAPQPRKTARRHRSPHGLGLWITDGELIEMLGVPKDEAARMIREMDRKHQHYAFPQKQKEWGNRRYRPAVEQWFERNYGPKMPVPPPRRPS